MGKSFKSFIYFLICHNRFRTAIGVSFVIILDIYTTVSAFRLVMKAIQHL
jgi:hypothetical protein